MCMREKPMACTARGDQSISYKTGCVLRLEGELEEYRIAFKCFAFKAGYQ